MKKKKTAIISLAVAASIACGTLAGCDLITTDSHKDYAQVIAEVDITGSEIFETGEFKDYKNAIKPASIIKRDMIASFVSSGYSAMSSYGWTYKDTFNAISESLVNRQLTIQYAMAYILKYEAQNGGTRTAAGYEAAVAGKTDSDEKLAGLAYFLDEDEKAQALYKTRTLFNNTLDTQEKSIIDEDEEDSSSVTVRTLPSGVNTANDDYYDEAYKVYTAIGSAEKGGVASACGTYETVKGSTPYTRKKAYSKFLASLRQNDLLFEGEDTTDFEGLSYFKLELISAYESAIITKLSELYQEIAEASLNATYLEKEYRDLLAAQEDLFKAEDGRTSFESALDSVSDTSFLLTTPDNVSSLDENANKYGYVINILLPFSTSQTAKLNAFTADYGDTNGNHFAQRTKLLSEVEATDQRATWFTGETDYGFEYADLEGAYTGGNDARTYLFFEDALTGNEKYEPMRNYYGKYTYNGTVTKDEDGDYVIKPNKISIDGFIGEMEGYLNQAFGKTVASGAKVENYYNRNISEYYKDKSVAGGKVDYSSFVYYEGKVNFTNAYDADKIFVSGTEENLAYSVVNELSFAYNTDTAGLNPYYGYSVVTGKTSFVSEFEYAAQLACKKGAGTYVVAPSDYGWHIVYCTFVFDKDVPFVFKAEDMEQEGTFSYNLYESVKSSVVSTYSSNQQSEILSAYSNSTCTKIYEERYSDLFELDNL